MSLERRTAEARRIVTIRQMQARERQAALASARGQESACEADLEKAGRAVQDECAAWLAYLQTARPAPAILQDFRQGIARLEDARARAATRLEEARAECVRQAGEVSAALMREDVARNIADKLGARQARRSEERRLQATEERTSYEWSRS